MKINLDFVDKEEIKTIIHEYSTIDREIESLSNEMERLFNKKKDLEEKALIIKDREALLMKNLFEKHGLGKLNLTDLTYEREF